jgi:hypothetical protein
VQSVALLRAWIVVDQLRLIVVAAESGSNNWAAAAPR